jgi:hypothetical protein
MLKQHVEIFGLHAVEMARPGEADGGTGTVAGEDRRARRVSLRH